MCRRVFLIFVVLLLACLAGSGVYMLTSRHNNIWQMVFDQVDTPAGSGGIPVTISIKSGDTAASIGEKLEKEGLIKNAMAFRWLASYYGADANLKAGDYELNNGMKPSEILAKLNQGLIKTTDVILLEGWRLEQIIAEMDKQNVFPRKDLEREILQGQYDHAFLRDRPGGASLEGYLFPDTYTLPAKLQPNDFVRLMLADFDRRFTPDMRQRAAAKGLNLHQAVTLASIVEREAVVSAERPIIAAVFLNRIRQGMPLQADPTVQYAVGLDPASVAKHGFWKKDLTKADLAIDSAYNTYVRTGLPPGPIANPGLASLKAVADAEPTDFLYFVAKNDGSHAFAKTLEEHNANVRRYSN